MHSDLLYSIFSFIFTFIWTIAAVPSFRPCSLSFSFPPLSFHIFLSPFFHPDKTSLCLFLISILVCLSLWSMPVHNTAFTLKAAVMMGMINNSLSVCVCVCLEAFFLSIYRVFCKDNVCVGRCAHMLGSQIPCDSWSQAFCINACVTLSPLFFISPLISPFLTLHASLLSDPPLCVVYTLHLDCSLLFSIPF